jgi:hypothetical protein
VIQSVDEFKESLKRDIARWKADAARAPGDLGILVQPIIDAGERVLADIERAHA